MIGVAPVGADTTVQVVTPVDSTPYVRIDAPAANAALTEPALTVAGAAESFGQIEGVILHTPRADYRLYAPYEAIGGQPRVFPSRVVFRTTTPLLPGEESAVSVEMRYRRPGDPITGAPRTLLVPVPVRFVRPGTVVFTTAPADTSYGRGFVWDGAVFGYSPALRFEMSIDAGTPQAMTVTGAKQQINGDGWPIRILRSSGDTTYFRVEPGNGGAYTTLAEGPHVVTVRVRNPAGGLIDSVTRRVVTYVKPVSYTLALLPDLGGGNGGAADVNAAGDVAGWAVDALGADRAVVWRSGAVQRLATNARSSRSQALALNDAGDIVGFSADTGARACEFAVHWRAAAWRYVANTLPSCPTVGAAFDVNTSGTIGVWTARGTHLDRNGILDSISTVALSKLNDAEQAVGSYYSTFDGVELSASYRIDPAFPTTRPPSNIGHPTRRLIDVNARGTVIGLYPPTPFVTPLGKPAIDLFSVLGPVAPVRVADNDVVLAFEDATRTIYLWRAGRAERVALATPDWRIDGVTGINAAGLIVGHASNTMTGRKGAVVLRPE